MNRVEAAAYGLALCYLANDTEELLTYRASSRDAFRQAPSWLPLPEDVRRDGWSQDHVNIGVTLIGVHWVGAALAGRRTQGRSTWFQNALWAWYLHGYGHLGLCAARRGYVSGAATAPLVIGYGAWALRTLKRAGVPTTASPAGVLVQFPLLLGVHAAAEAISRSRTTA